MATLIPNAATLLQATTSYLENELLPTLSGYHRFQTRISINVLKTALRELQLAPTHSAAEHNRLATLLRHNGDTAALNSDLANAITNGSIALNTPGLTDHLRQTLQDALAINNPKWINADPKDT